MKRFVCGLMVALACLVSRPANAESILFTGTGLGANSVTLNASAFFDISGSSLVIRLTNTGDSSSGSGSDVPGNQLTGLFFDLPSGITLTPVSAKIAAGSILQGNMCNSSPGCTSSTTNVGGEFRYSTGSYPGGADRGIASSGYVGGSANFNGVNLDDPNAIDGSNFSIVAPVGNSTFNPNGGLSSVPLIEGSVEFVMTIGGGTLHASDLANVSFQYGTSTSEARFSGSKGPGGGGTVPEPATAFLALSGIAVAMQRARRRTHQS